MAIQASSSWGAESLSFHGLFETVAARAPPGAADMPMPISSPPAADPAVKIIWRRLRPGAAWGPRIAGSSGLHRVRGAMNGAAQGRIGPAAADVGHVRVDVGVRRLGEGLQERGHRHDLPRL